MLAANVRDAGALGPEHPLVPVGRQKIDAHFVHVERKRAQTLNRIEEQQCTALVRDLGDPRHVVPITGREADPAHGDDSRSLVAGLGQPVEVEPAADVGRHAARFDAATLAD